MDKVFGRRAAAAAAIRGGSVGGSLLLLVAASAGAVGAEAMHSALLPSGALAADTAPVPDAAAISAPAPVPEVTARPAEAPYVPTPIAPGASMTANAWRMHEGQLYKRNWGVEVLGIHSTSSGYMLAFRYRVLDPERAHAINDAKNRAYVVDEVSGARLAVPAMENIGELRQTSRPIAGQNYFIVFGNPGQLVKKGGRVSVVIGNFRVPNLVVE